MSVRNQKRQANLAKKKSQKEILRQSKIVKTNEVQTSSRKNYLLQVAYDGATYGGYAKQKFPNTICNQLEIALFKTLHEKVKTHEASRTDSKVHALDQQVTFKTRKPINLEKFIINLNDNLPSSIRVGKITIVPYDFHPQYAAKNKTYRFKIHTKFDIFLTNYSYFWDKPDSLTDSDIERINEICSLFVGEHDFKGFSSSKSDSSNSIRTINKFIFARYNKNHLFFEINADGFLYNMIRILIPTIINSFENELTNEEIIAILESKERKLAASTIGGHALYLHQINFK